MRSLSLSRWAVLKIAREVAASSLFCEKLLRRFGDSLRGSNVASFL